MEGYKRNKFYLNSVIESYDKILFLCIQEHWLSNYEANENFSNDFTQFNFITTSSDIFLEPEEIMLNSGPIWHGTSLGWHKSIDLHVTKIQIIGDSFCGIIYNDPL